MVFLIKYQRGVEAVGSARSRPQRSGDLDERKRDTSAPGFGSESTTTVLTVDEGAKVLATSGAVIVELQDQAQAVRTPSQQIA